MNKIERNNGLNPITDFHNFICDAHLHLEVELLSLLMITLSVVS